MLASSILFRFSKGKAVYQNSLIKLRSDCFLLFGDCLICLAQLLVNSFHHYLEGVNEMLQYYFKTEDLKKWKIPHPKQTTYYCSVCLDIQCYSKFHKLSQRLDHFEPGIGLYGPCNKWKLGGTLSQSKATTCIPRHFPKHSKTVNYQRL